MSYDQLTAQAIAELRDKDATIARLTAEVDALRELSEHIASIAHSGGLVDLSEFGLSGFPCGFLHCAL